MDGVSAGSVVSTAGAGKYEANGDLITAGGSSHTDPGRAPSPTSLPSTACCPAPRIAEHASGVLDGFTGETVAERIDRYNRWAGYPYPTVTHIGTTAVVGNYDTDRKSRPTPSTPPPPSRTASPSTGPGCSPSGAGPAAQQRRSTGLHHPRPHGRRGQPGPGLPVLLHRPPHVRQRHHRHHARRHHPPRHRLSLHRRVRAHHRHRRRTRHRRGPRRRHRVARQDLFHPAPPRTACSVRLSQLDDADTAACSRSTWARRHRGHPGMPDQAARRHRPGVVLGIEETYTHADLLWTATSVSATSTVNVLISTTPSGVLDRPTMPWMTRRPTWEHPQHRHRHRRNRPPPPT